MGRDACAGSNEPLTLAFEGRGEALPGREYDDPPGSGTCLGFEGALVGYCVPPGRTRTGSGFGFGFGSSSPSTNGRKLQNPMTHLLSGRSYV
jgi:hypothetical protein